MTRCGKAAMLLFLIPIWSEAFTPTSRIIFGASSVNTARRLPSSKYPLRSSSSSSSSSTTLPEVSTMKASEMKKELESYGISTKSFLERGELVDALTQARENGATVKQSPTTTTESSSSTTSKNENRSSSVGIQEELEKIKSMSVKEMKQELRTLGVSTNSLFEKRELAEALAKARVEGPSSRTNDGGDDDESKYESYVEYADVEVLPSDGPGPRPKRSASEDSSNGPNQNNPFGGGGAAGMGGFADILKNMAAGGGAAAAGGDSVFDSMGGMGDMFKNMASGGGANIGDMFGGMGGAAQKAQEMMQNPKVREIVMKAQGNPKIMKAVQECMSNPAAFAKYQNDPEVGTLINELKKYI